jgi:iron-sulfur cluster repair protein YtfE (RIC family)
MEKRPPQNETGHGSGNGTAGKVRDRLCQLIRQHKLDAELVKAYAVDFCGTKTLREASREQVESFVQQLAEWAEKDRNALLCQLNSYLPPKQEERIA